MKLVSPASRQPVEQVGHHNILYCMKSFLLTFWSRPAVRASIDGSVKTLTDGRLSAISSVVLLDCRILRILAMVGADRLTVVPAGCFLPLIRPLSDDCALRSRRPHAVSPTTRTCGVIVSKLWQQIAETAVDWSARALIVGYLPLLGSRNCPHGGFASDVTPPHVGIRVCKD